MPLGLLKESVAPKAAKWVRLTGESHPAHYYWDIREETPVRDLPNSAPQPDRNIPPGILPANCDSPCH